MMHMIIAVVAANGRSGTIFVETALVRGHQIRAGVHGDNPFSERDGLTVLPCDATNAAEVEQLLEGAEAVVSLIGHVPHSPAFVQSNAIQTILAAMEEMDVQRLISLTGTGVRFPDDKITPIDRMLNLSIRLIDPKRIQDGIHHAEIMKASSVQWTLIRVLKLTNDTLQTFGLSADGPTRTFTSRATVAVAICHVLEQQSFIQQAPIITNYK
jgi:hypothetical protein